MLTYAWLEKTNRRFQNTAGKDFRQSGNFCAGFPPAFCEAWRKGASRASVRRPEGFRVRRARAWMGGKPSTHSWRGNGSGRLGVQKDFAELRTVREIAGAPRSSRAAKASRFEFLFTSGEENRRTHGDGADNVYPQNPLWPPSILPYKGRRHFSGGPPL